MDTEHVRQTVKYLDTQDRERVMYFIQVCLTIFLPYLEAEHDENCTALPANINCSTSEHFSRCFAACSDYDPMDQSSSCHDVCVSCT